MLLNRNINSNFNILALIPARGGSKGVLRKNIKKINNIPLIAYSINIARQIPLISRVIVSTDDEEIAQISRNYGAETPFIRPHNIAEDLSLDYDVFEHTLSWLRDNESYVPDYIIHLRPTSPFRKKDIIENAIQTFIENPHFNSLRSVSLCTKTPYKMWSIYNNELVPLLKNKQFDEPYNQPRQLLPKTYWQNGYIDITKPDTIFNQKNMCGKKILPFIIDDKITDIDSEEDFQNATERIKEEKFNYFHNTGESSV
tara:strand:+ start:480 stop:1247 length:768 start_codon:yes stop_codon:yes gene_type:complete